MKKILCFYCLIIFVVQVKGVSEIDSLLFQLEETMAKRHEFDERKNNQIDQLKDILRKSNNSKEQQFFINNQLIDEYLKYNFDSTIHYLSINLKLSEDLNNQELIYQSNIKMADIMASAGRNFEAYDVLIEIDKQSLSNELKIEYYKAFIKLYNQVSFYAPISDNYHKYYKKVEEHTDSLILYLDPQSDDFLSIMEKRCRDKRNILECKKINTQRLANTEIGSRDYSLITFERSLLYGLEENEEMRMKFLILSAISDIKSSVKDNASLTDLAFLLHKEGKVERAHRYIKFSFDDASFYNSELRLKVISEVLAVINDAYEHKIKKQQSNLHMLLFVVSMLTVFLLLAVFLILQQVISLRRTQRALKDVNDRLNVLNNNLAESNQKLNLMNDELSEANHLKEHYIGNFLTICSDYIDKLDQMNKMVNKKIATRKVEELFAETKSRKMIDREIMEFYANFDETFLNIFPNFVEELNVLLIDEERIQLKSEERLNTELRIFALIRLGISDSSKIAKLLRYSVNTIYNYRVKVKNKAKGNRDNFEQDIKTIDAGI